MNIAMLVVGAALVAAPFVWITYIIVRDMGWLDAAKVWGRTIAIAGAIAAGAVLIGSAVT